MSCFFPSFVFFVSLCAVGDKAVLDVAFKDFAFPPPDSFDEIMFEKNIF